MRFKERFLLFRTSEYSSVTLLSVEEFTNSHLLFFSGKNVEDKAENGNIKGRKKHKNVLERPRGHLVTQVSQNTFTN